MKKLTKVLIATLMLMGLVACANEAPKENPTPSSTSQPTQLSGKVTVYCPSPSDMAEEIAAAFTAKTGVQVEMFQGTTGEITARLEAEKANPVADVVIMASWADGLAMKETGNLLSYAPTNADLVYPDWKDADNMLFGTSASAVGVIYNTTIFETLNADWDVLGTDVTYQGQLALPDPIKSGSAKDFLSGYVYHGQEAAKSVMASWANNGMVIPGANKAALESVTTGEKGILVAGVDYNAYSAMAKGEPLNIYYPESGTVINPRPAMILNTSKNQDNAKAYMDFLLSEEAQAIVAKAYLLPGRSDIKAENRANVEEIPTFDLDWEWMMANSGEIAQSILDSVQ